MNTVAAALQSRSWAVSGRLDLRGLRLRELPDVFADGRVFAERFASEPWMQWD